MEIGLLKLFAEYDRTPELQEIRNVMGKNESNRWQKKKTRLPGDY